MSSLNRKRLWWLATCVVFVACASAPAPKATKKKKKKKKKRDSIALKQKKDADRNEDDEKPDKPAKKEQDKDDKDDEVAIADDEVTVVDDDGDTPSKKKSKKDAAAEKKRKKEEEAEAAAEKKRQKEEAVAEAAAEKKRKKEEAAEAAAEKKREKEEAAEAAAEKKRKKEEVAEEEPPPDEEDEPKPKKGKKTVAAKGKKNGKAKKPAEEEIEVAAEDPVEEPVEDEPKPVKKKPAKIAKASAKTKSAPAEVDMTSDEPVIDMEDESSGSSLDTRVDDEPPAGRVAAIPVPGVDDDSEEQSVTAEATPIGANPLAINERPLTLQQGKLAVHGGLRFGALTVTPVGGMETSSTATGFALGVNYGAGESTEVGLDYTLGISPGSVKGPLTIHGAYRALNGKLDLAIAAAAAVDFSDFTDPATMMTTTSTAFSLQLGAWARYRLNRKLSLFSGLPALPASSVSLSKLSLPLPPQPYQLVIGLNNAGTVALDVPVGLAYQATPKIYAFGMLNLAHIRVANTVNAFLFKDFIPLSLGGFYSLDKLDIGAVFSDDLKQGTDYLRFDTFVRYSIK